MINKGQILSGLFFISCCTAWGQKNPCNPTGLPYTSLPGDTTIILPHGTQLTFNRCEFFDIRDCLDLTEAYDIESIRKLNLTTLDRNGNFLLTAGMFCMKLSGDCVSKPCFEVPVKVRMPLPTPPCAACRDGTFRLYTSTDGIWADSSDNRFKVIDINGTAWLEFFSYCANICYNADCKMPTVKIKFKANNVKSLEQVIISSPCPLGVLKYNPKKGRKKVIAKFPCFNTDSVKISAQGYDKAGNSLTSSDRSLSELNHGHSKKNCPKKKRKVVKRVLGLFPIREGAFYRKYFIE